MSGPVDLPRLPLHARVEGTFLVLDVQARSSDTGDGFTLLVLGNSSGRITTDPFWPDRAGEIAGLRKGHIVQIIGEITRFRDRKQLRVISLRPLPPGAADPAALLPSVGAIDRYWTALDGWRKEIGRPGVRRAVDLFYEDDAFRLRYERCPGSVSGHHAAVGGLLQHTTEVAAVGRTLARACGADHDLVLAGALLHDIGKLDSYRWEGMFDHTDEGRLLGHVVLGALALERRLTDEPTPPCSDTERLVLTHLILSHHGRLEWGSPVQPMTLEAEVLHWADNASAKTASVAAALGNDEYFPDGPVSSAIRHLEGRRLYRDGAVGGGSADG